MGEASMHRDASQSIRGPRSEGTGERMYDAYTPGAQRALDRAQILRPGTAGSSVEPVDLLAALADEAEGRAAELMARFGLDPARVLNALGMESRAIKPRSRPRDAAGRSPMNPPSSSTPLPHSAALRAVLLDATSQAKAIDRGVMLVPSTCWRVCWRSRPPRPSCLLAAGLELEGLRSHLAEQLSAHAAPLLAARRNPPAGPVRPGPSAWMSAGSSTPRPTVPARGCESSRITPGSCSMIRA